MAKRRKVYLENPTLDIPQRTACRHPRQSTPIDDEEDVSLQLDFDFSDVSVGALAADASAESADEEDQYEMSTSFFLEENIEQPTNCSASKVLYSGAPNDLTVFTTHVLLHQYAHKHSLTNEAIKELLHLLSVILPHDSKHPKSVYKLRKFFLNLYDQQTPTLQKYCEVCHKLLQQNAVCECGGKTSEFITVPIGPQLKQRLENPEVWEAIRRPKNISDGPMTDITDGSKYKILADYTSQGNLTMTLNTDGVQLFKSSSVSMWPVWTVINELPPTLRFSKKNKMLVGLWCGREKPTMNTFLRPLVDSMNELYLNGIEVATPKGVKTIKAAVVAATCDLPARALVLNMRQFNGLDACHRCKDSGKNSTATPMVRWWPYNPHQQLRSHKDIIHSSFKTQDGDIHDGIKAASVISLHRPLDVCKGVLVDALHCVYLGITRKLLTLWFSVGTRDCPFSVRAKIELCDKRLLNIKVPDIISRTPRSLKEVARWKGSELKHWLLLYSVPVLKGILRDVYFEHYVLLVAAMRVLESECITEEDLDNSEKWLKAFYKDYTTYYGVKHCTMNVHLLSHLTECVRDWGPLWGYSCFAFESANHDLRKLFHGTKDMTEQMSFTYVVSQLLPLEPMETSSPAVQHLYNFLFGRKSQFQHFIQEKLWALGGLQIEEADDEIKRYDNSIETMKVSSKIKWNNEVYFSKEYGRVTKRNSYTVRDLNGDVWQVRRYAILPSKTVAFVNKISIVPSHQPKGIFKAQVTQEKCIIDATTIDRKLAFIETDDTNYYVAELPSILQID